MCGRKLTDCSTWLCSEIESTHVMHAHSKTDVLFKHLYGLCGCAFTQAYVHIKKKFPVNNKYLQTLSGAECCSSNRI